MQICGLLTEMYNGIEYTEDKIIHDFGSDTFCECLKREYITKTGINYLNLQLYQITTVGKDVYDKKTY